MLIKIYPDRDANMGFGLLVGTYIPFIESQLGLVLERKGKTMIYSYK